MLDYFVWYHGVVLGVSLLLAAIGLSDYANFGQYDGAEIDTKHAWVTRGGGVVRPATKSEVYAHYNPGRSYRRDYKSQTKGVFVFAAILWIGLALVLPPLLIRRVQWAEPYCYFNHPLYLLPTLLVAALAAAASLRAAFGFSRWRRLQKKRLKTFSKRSGVTLTAEEQAGWGLSEADSIISWVAAFLFFAIGVWQVLILHEARKAPSEPLAGAPRMTMILLAVQGGLTVLYGIWALIEHLLRKRACR